MFVLIMRVSPWANMTESCDKNFSGLVSRPTINTIYKVKTTLL